jgi:hypothetical protein
MATSFTKLTGRLILRLAIGRWPAPDETDLFQRAMLNRFIELPPLLRGLMVQPDMRELLPTALRTMWFAESQGMDIAALEQAAGQGGLPPIPDLLGNIFTAWTGPKLAFLHLEKCGGVAVVKWLTEQFHPDQIDPDPLRAAPPHNFYRAPPGIGRDVVKYSLLWGHFGLPALERIDPERFIFTMLRDPRERLISLYRYWRAVNPAMIDDIEHDPVVGSAHRHDFLGFLRDPEPLLRDYIDNFYVRRLTGRYGTGAATDPLARAPVTALNQAVAALDRIGFVGITEQMDRSIHRLAALIGARPPSGTVRGNVAAENHTDPSGWFRRTESFIVTPEAEAEIERLTRLDRAVYETARARFDAASHPAKAVVAA